MIILCLRTYRTGLIGVFVIPVFLRYCLFSVLLRLFYILIRIADRIFVNYFNFIDIWFIYDIVQDKFRSPFVPF